MRTGPLAPAPPDPLDGLAETEPDSPAAVAAAGAAPAAPPAFAEGATFGPYRILRRLGRGGMGEVFLAWDERLDRRVAIKRVRADRSPDGRERQRFRREARAAARLNHPAIVQIFDLVEDERGDAIVMEHVEGTTLAELLAGGPCDPALAVRLGRDVALGLAAAHAAGLVHRDLKTQNVMLSAAGQVKILDFGLARSLLPPADGEENLTARGLVVGTFHAMSPEQARGGAVDARADLFAFGVLLYELLTGQSPFRGASRLDTLQRVLTHDPPPVDQLRPGLPPALAPLVDRCLAKEAARRPASADEVARALDAMAREASPRRWKWPAAMVAAAAAAGLVAVVLGAAVWQLARPGPPLRVAVMRPVVSPLHDATLDLAAAAVLAATLSDLGARQGLTAVGPEAAGEGAATATATATATSSPVLAARGAAALQVLSFLLQREGAMGRLSMVCIAGSDGRVLWSETFAVPVGPGELRALAVAVAARLRRAYAEHPPRPNPPAADMREADYADFVRLGRWLDAAEEGLLPAAPAAAVPFATRAPLPAAELARLERLLRQAPRFLDGLLLGAAVYEEQEQAGGDPRDGRRACDLARRAAALAPDDPRPLDRLAWAALAAGRTREAAEAVADLERRAPADPAILELESRLAEARGDAGEALAAMRRAADRLPSWRNLASLARLAARRGDLAAARARFRDLLARSLGAAAVVRAQADMELESGDPARAEALLAALVRRAPTAADLAALCRTRAALGRPGEAMAACRESLALAPGQPFVGLDLADAQLALGRRQEAAATVGAVLAALRRDADAGDGTPPGGPLQRLAEARCLASLGRGEEAVALAQQTLQGAAAAATAGAPVGARLVYQAALVYALAGDRSSALDNVRQALAGGVPRRLFGVGGLRSLAADPELRALLAPVVRSADSRSRKGS